MNRSDSHLTEAAMRRLLGVSDEADLAQIKAAFRTKIKLLHPDRCQGTGSGRAVERLVEAYAGLSALYSTSKHPSGKHECSSITDVFALGELAVTSTDPAVRRCAVEALAKSGRKTAYTYLRQVLADGNQAVVKAAVAAVAELHITQAGGELSALFAGADSSLRTAVIQAFEKLGCTAAGWEAVMKIALESYDPAVRSLAVQLNNRFCSEMHRAQQRMA